jgi:hypothetical protein
LDGENCITRSFITCTLCKKNLNGQVKEDEMVRGCSMKGGEEYMWLICGIARMKKTTRKTKIYISGMLADHIKVDL